MKKYLIYRLTFPNKKVYIGQTYNFKDRMRKHKYDSKKYNTLIYNAIRKYGWDNIKKEIILYCDENCIDYYERELIKLYNSTDKNVGYNLESGGHKNKNLSKETIEKKKKSALGKKHSKETIELLRKLSIGNTNMLGKKHSKETKEKLRKMNLGKKQSNDIILKKSKSVICYNKINNDFVAWYQSIKEAAKDTNVSRSNIGMVCNYRRKSAGGYTWKFT